MIQIEIFGSGLEFSILDQPFHAAVSELLGKQSVCEAALTGSALSPSLCCIFMRTRFYRWFKKNPKNQKPNTTKIHPPKKPLTKPKPKHPLSKKMTNQPNPPQILLHLLCQNGVWKLVYEFPVDCYILLTTIFRLWPISILAGSSVKISDTYSVPMYRF